MSSSNVIDVPLAIPQISAYVTTPPKRYNVIATSPPKYASDDVEKEKTPTSSISLEKPPKGTWLHAGYHLTSGASGPQVLSLPFAIASLGWGPGLATLCLGGLVSFYAYKLQIKVIERAAEESGRVPQTFRDLSMQAIGERWSTYLVAPLQFIVCFATVVSCIVLGGQALKAIFEGQELSLYQFTIVFGCMHMLLSQLPSLHSLRHLNLCALLASISYCALVVYGCISAGSTRDLRNHEYSIKGTHPQKMFGVFNAVSILSNVYGNVITVEIQSTIRQPAARNMMRGLLLCYVVVISTILPVAVTGYWAFGNISNGNILQNIFSEGGKQYMPSWSFILLNILILVQLIVTSVMYSQPTFTVLEEPLYYSKKPMTMWQGILLRLASRCIFTVFATLLAAMLPYFGSINALIGALGYTPLVFVVPKIFYLCVFKPRSGGLERRLIYFTLAIFSAISFMGCVASVQQLVMDAKKYHLFANL
ncbi:hypothetical protein KP509_17G017900 [Ceratopteris richardii]|uniref:Amino acid transporter transmembrane domain-containing protein n=4 Tax=Ceratopteris richardii TaxID=49495 RepID=A0A8T2SSI3_CERRI|nr:hypothetical protein KP509_17G017900 [Ceratopteris richardii]KAH7372721.1 hypothetical protein KP509_17G017900 [Ceratopteris richardii]KAH7372722.1 hypothetical protein KP509_17G017900 [Ceratopteris richardii]